MEFLTERREMLDHLLRCYQRGFTDTTGGIATVRVGPDLFLNTATGISWRKFEDRPEDVVLVTGQLEKVDGQRMIPASSQLAIALLKAFPHAGAVIHNHSNCTGAFAACGISPRPITPFAQRVGEVPILHDEPEDTWLANGGDEGVIPLIGPEKQVLNGTPRLIQDRHCFTSTVIRALRPRAAELDRHGLAFLVGFDYGLFAIGRQIGEAYDTIERVENNTRLLLNATALGGKPLPAPL